MKILLSITLLACLACNQSGKIEAAVSKNTDSEWTRNIFKPGDSIYFKDLYIDRNAETPFFVSYMASNKSKEDFGNCIIYLPGTWNFDNKEIKKRIVGVYPRFKNCSIVVLGITQMYRGQADNFFKTDHSQNNFYR